MRRIFGAIICCNCSFFQKIWLNLWFGTALCKTPMEFPATIWVLRVTYVVCNHGNTQCINCVDAFGIIYVLYFFSHHGQSFKLFYKKTKKPLHKQGLHPAEIPKALKRDGLLGFTTRIIWKLRLTSFVVNLPRSGRPQKLSMEVNSVCRNCAK